MLTGLEHEIRVTLVMASDTMRFTLEASSRLTQCRRFKGVTLGEPDPQAGDRSLG